MLLTEGSLRFLTSASTTVLLISGNLHEEAAKKLQETEEIILLGVISNPIKSEYYKQWDQQNLGSCFRPSVDLDHQRVRGRVTCVINVVIVNFPQTDDFTHVLVYPIAYESVARILVMPRCIQKSGGKLHTGIANTEVTFLASSMDKF